MRDEPDETDRFDAALREWAARPPGTSPAAAARAIRGRIESRPVRRPAAPRWAWAAAGLVAILGVAGLLRLGRAGLLAPLPLAPPAETVALLSPGAAPLSEGQALLWLDPETPLYMSFAPPAVAGPSGGGS